MKHSIESITKVGMPFTELGSTGLKRWSGTIDEEFLRELKGIRGIKIYREMSDNDPIVGAMLYAMKHLTRQTTWTMEAASEDNADQEAAQFIRECQEDMSSTWTDIITEIQSKNIFGWSWHEVIYKRRIGDTPDPSTRSRFIDGRIGWRKMPIRAQESLYEWKFDDKSGSVQAMIQQDPVKFNFVAIPIANSLLFRTTQEKGNPEGRSLLRTAYTAWYRKKNIEMYEGIGIARDLAGIPVAWVPPALLLSNASADYKSTRTEIEKVVRNLHRDEQEGILWPLSYDDKGNKLYDLTLLSSAGTRQFDIDKTIQRYSQQIAMSVLADVILIGHEAVGSFALSESKGELFAASLDSLLQADVDVFNRIEIPRLFALNGWKLEKLPIMKATPIQRVNIKDLGDYIAQLAGAGIELFPDDALENYLRVAAKMPEKPDDIEMVSEPELEAEPQLTT